MCCAAFNGGIAGCATGLALGWSGRQQPALCQSLLLYLKGAAPYMCSMTWRQIFMRAASANTYEVVELLRPTAAHGPVLSLAVKGCRSRLEEV